jgi:hypothetical protein
VGVMPSARQACWKHLSTSSCVSSASSSSAALTASAHVATSAPICSSENTTADLNGKPRSLSRPTRWLLPGAVAAVQLLQQLRRQGEQQALGQVGHGALDERHGLEPRLLGHADRRVAELLLRDVAPRPAALFEHGHQVAEGRHRHGATLAAPGVLCRAALRFARSGAVGRQSRPGRAHGHVVQSITSKNKFRSKARPG